MVEDSWEELQKIPESFHARSEVLQLRLWVLMKKRDWAGALETANFLCALQPDMPVAHLDAAYCLHELDHTEEARERLLKGPNTLKEYPTFHYNLACYEACLGNLDQAREYLSKAIEMNPKYDCEAKKDPDLSLLFKV
jgi:tetratricopeptide (TPR) repeat protein